MIKVLSLFSGYGADNFALKKAGIEFESVGHSDIDKFANKIHKLNHPGSKELGDITKIKPEELEDFDLMTGGFSCVLPDTLITSQRGNIPIKDIIIGDMVLTHKNRWRKVIKTMNQPSNHYYNVSVMGSPSLCITENHPLYCKKMVRTYVESGKTMPRIFSTSEWIKTNELRNDDFVAFGTWSDKYSTNEKNLTKEECWLIGRYVADGFIQNSKRNRKNHKVIFCIGKNKQADFLKIANKSKYYIGTTEDRTAMINRIIDEKFMNLCLECGKGVINKKIPFWIMNLPTNKLKCFMEGYMSGDGCFTNNKFHATTISKVLCYQLGQIVHRLYKTPYSITFTKTVNQHDTWMLRFDNTVNKQDNSVWLNNNIWGRFKSKERINKKVQVYNIEVEEDNSYVANNIVLHNCQPFSISGKRQGFKDKTRGTLFFEIIRIAEVKKPKYMLLENVQGIINHDNGRTHTTILESLRKIGYSVIPKLANSKDYGIPQNRQRIWYICKRVDQGGWGFMEFLMPQKTGCSITVQDILEEKVDAKYFLSKKQIKRILDNERHRNGMLIQKNNSPTLCARDYKDGGKRIQIADYRVDEGIRTRKDGISPCLMARQREDISGMPFVYNTTHTKANGKRYKTDGMTFTLEATNSSSNVVAVHSLQPRSPDRPSIQKNPKAGGSGHIKKTDGTTYCLDTGNSQAVEIAPCLTTELAHQTGFTFDAEMFNNMTGQFRRLTPRECFRLQGFLDDEIKFGDISDSQLYKLAGNGWDQNIASIILKEMFKNENQKTKPLEVE